MGIHGIYREIGPGTRIALSKFALDTFISKRRPLRLAVDISIWLFQVKSSKGGEQPALRTFYYRLLRLTSLAIHPLFVFDGPKKPKFKRNKHTGPNVCTIPEFLAKQLLKAFGLPYHVAPGEAEAECAHLQQAGVVDAVLSEDVDTIMFGSGITLRNWSAEGKGKTPTHVNVHDSKLIKKGSSGLDRDGMILVAMMSGGDYIPEGIPGCGPKTACEAARAGFGSKLCSIQRGNRTAFEEWKKELAHELKTNDSKFFRVKHGSLQIPDSFPNREILGYYTRPAVSSPEQIEEMSDKIVWEEPIQLAVLRKFTEEAFKWETIIGAKKFIRTLAPALIVRKLSYETAEPRSDTVIKIHQARQHASTDGTPELRVSYIPQDVVDIDLSKESPETSEMMGRNDDHDDEIIAGDDDAPPTNTQMRPYLFDPSEVTKSWVFEHFVRMGAPRQFNDWTKVCTQKASRSAMTGSSQTAISHRGKGIDDSMPAGSMHQFTRISKPVSSNSVKAVKPREEPQPLPFPALPASSYSNRQLAPFRNNRSLLETSAVPVIDLVGGAARSHAHLSAQPQSNTNRIIELSSTSRRRTPLARARTEGSIEVDSTYTLDLTAGDSRKATSRGIFTRGTSTAKRKAHNSSPVGTPQASKKSSSSELLPILITSSPVRQEAITRYFSLSPSRDRTQRLDLSAHSHSNRSASEIIAAPDRIPTKSFVGLSKSSDSTTVNKPADLRAATGIDASIQFTEFNHSRLTDQNVFASPTLRAAATALETTGAGTQSTRRQLIVPFSISKPPSTLSLQTSKKTSREQLRNCDGNAQRLRLRQSLRGAFAVEDPLGCAIRHPASSESTWKLDDVSVLDLTGNM